MRLSRPRARQLATLSCHDIACPRCDAAPGMYCTRPFGEPMMGYHFVRHYALAALKAQLRARWTSDGAA